MRRFLRLTGLLLCVLVLVLALVACGSPGIDTPGGGTQGGGTLEIGAEDAKIVFLDEEPPATEEPTVDPLQAKGVLSEVTFTADESTRKEARYTGEELVLEVVDATGQTWKLTVPEQALLSPETIAMTALKDVKDAQGRPLTGVLLEPDGLQFLMPGTLEVIGGTTEEAVLFSADHAGKAPRLTPSFARGGVRVGLVGHFSTALESPPSLDNPNDRAALLAYCAFVLEEAEALLEADASIPKPPVIDLEDFQPEQVKAKIKLYAERYFNRQEAAYSAALMGVYEAYRQIHGPDAKETKHAKDVWRRIIERLKAKLDGFVAKYSSQPDKFFYALALLEPAKMASIADDVLKKVSSQDFKPEDEDAYLKSFKNSVDRWATATVRYVADEVGQRHNYRMVMSAFALLIATGKANDANWRDLLTKALTFELSYDFYTRDKDFYIKVEGEATLQPVLEGDRFAALKGEAKARYAEVKADFTLNPYVIEPHDFTAQTICAFFGDRVSLGWTNIGSLDETHINKDKDGDITMKNPIVETTFSLTAANLQVDDVEGYKYQFSYPFTNGQPLVVELNLPMKDIDAALHVSLTHTPKP